MKINLSSVPFLKLLLPFVLGIVFGYYFPIKLFYSFIVIISFLLIFCIISTFFPKYNQIKNNILVLSLGLALFFMGCLQANLKTPTITKKSIDKYINNTDEVIGIIDEQFVKKTKAFKTIVKLEKRILAFDTSVITGKAIVYIQNTDSVPLKVGDIVVLKSNLFPITNSRNIGAFDYSRYCAFDGILVQSFATQNDILKIGHKNNLIKDFLNNTREKILSILKKNLTDSLNLGIAEALLIGYKNDLNKDLVENYSRTGVVHIIAISGMHLGFIYLALLWILKYIPFLKHQKKTQIIIIFIIIWFFTLITGAAASIVRAAVMLSVFLLGKYLNKQSSSLNLLAASAFFLLLYNPFWLWDVGFQLSYAAVLGISLFYKKIENVFYFKHKFLNDRWTEASVTLAAQIFTIPLSIYHFHQFPILFLIVNLIIVPISTFALAAICILILVNKISFLSFLAKSFINLLLNIMNAITSFCSKLSFAVWDNIYADYFSTILFYIFLFASSIYIYFKSKKSMYASLISLLLFLFYISFVFLKQSNQHQLVFYNLNKLWGLDIVNGKKYQFVGNDSIEKKDIIRNFNLKPTRLFLGCSMPNQKQIPTNNNVITTNNTTLLLLDSTINIYEAFNFDYVFITSNINTDQIKAIGFIKTKKVIIANSVNMFKTNQIINFCDSLSLPYHSIANDGALLINLKKDNGKKD